MTLPEEPIQQQIRSASFFKAQAMIGWDQFFRGCIAKAWLLMAHTTKNWHVLQQEDQTAW
jgi:hypothetical protein